MRLCRRRVVFVAEDQKNGKRAIALRWRALKRTSVPDDRGLERPTSQALPLDRDPIDGLPQLPPSGAMPEEDSRFVSLKFASAAGFAARERAAGKLSAASPSPARGRAIATSRSTPPH